MASSKKTSTKISKKKPKSSALDTKSNDAKLNQTGGRTLRRVLIGKPGLDGHDRGAKVIARALRDAGHEVIYTGLHQTPQMIVSAAVQEDVELVGLSILSGAHIHLVKEILKLMKAEGLTGVRVFVGGIIPDDDIVKLKKMGVSQVFTPGTSMDKVVQVINKL